MSVLARIAVWVSEFIVTVVATNTSETADWRCENMTDDTDLIERMKLWTLDRRVISKEELQEDVDAADAPEELYKIPEGLKKRK